MRKIASSGCDSDDSRVPSADFDEKYMSRGIYLAKKENAKQ